MHINAYLHTHTPANVRWTRNPCAPLSFSYREVLEMGYPQWHRLIHMDFYICVAVYMYIYIGMHLCISTRLSIFLAVHLCICICNVPLSLSRIAKCSKCANCNGIALVDIGSKVVSVCSKSRGASTLSTCKYHGEPYLAARYREKKTRWFRVESAIFLFTRRVLAFFGVNPAKSCNQPFCIYPERLF